MSPDRAAQGCAVIYMDAGNSQPEWDCSVYPMNLSRARALELRAIHAGCHLDECTVLMIAMLALITQATELDIARARRAAQRHERRR